MVADGGLRLAQRLLQLARADLAGRRHQAQQAQADRVGEGGEATGPGPRPRPRRGARPGPTGSRPRVDLRAPSSAGCASAIRSTDVLTNVDAFAKIDASTIDQCTRRTIRCPESSSPSTCPTSTPPSPSTPSCSRPSRPSAGPGYANFAIAEPPLKLVLIEGTGPARHPEPPRRRGGGHRRRGRRHRPPPGRGPGHRHRGPGVVLLRRAGQGVGRRPRRRAVGDLHRPGRRRDADRRAAHRRRPATTPCAARRRPSPPPAAAELAIPPRPPGPGRGPRHRPARGRRSSARASPPSGCRPTTPASSCSRTRPPPPPPWSAIILARRRRSRAPTSTRSSPWPTGPSGELSTGRGRRPTSVAQVVGRRASGRWSPTSCTRCPRSSCPPTVRSSGGAVAGRGRRHLRPAPRRSSAWSAPAGRRRPLRRRRLHRRGLLLHLVDVVRQPRGHRRPHPHRHLRRHRLALGAGLRAWPRWSARRWPWSWPGRSTRGDGRRSPPHRPSGGVSMSDVPAGALPLRPQRGPVADGARRGSTTWPGVGRWPRRADRHPARRSTRPRWRPWPRSASTSRSESPKRWTDEIVGAADVVVTMGCGDACPFVPGKRYEDWLLTDPFGKSVDEVRPVRDEIRRRVVELARRASASPLPEAGLAPPPPGAAIDSPR